MQDASSRRGGQRRAAREVSIKGSSVPKPTPVIVANLVKGTSPEDVRLTFDALGRLVYVREHHVPSLGANAVAYEVAFEQRADAQAACKKYHGVLADGRVLQVTMKEARPSRRRRAPPPKEPEVSERPAPARTGGSQVSCRDRTHPAAQRRSHAVAQGPPRQFAPGRAAGPSGSADVCAEAASDEAAACAEKGGWYGRGLSFYGLDKIACLCPRNVDDR